MALENVKFYNDVKLHLVKQDETKNGTPRVSFCWVYLDDDGNRHYLWNSVIYSGDYSPEVFQRTMQDMLPREPQFHRCLRLRTRRCMPRP